MKESLQNLIDIIMNPKAVFTRLKSEPKWVVVFIIYCSFSIILAWTLVPYTQRLLAVRSADTLLLNKPLSVVSAMLFSMSYSILMVILLSIILTVSARCCKVASAVQFKHIYAAFVHIMLVRTMTFSVNAGLLPIFRNIEDIQSPIDTRAIPGLHLLAGSLQNQHVLMFLSYISPVAVWYVFVLTIGIHIFAEISKVSAFFVALIIWLFRVSLDVTFVAVFLS